MQRAYNRRIMFILLFLVFLILTIWISNVPGYIMKQFYPVKYRAFVVKYAEQNSLDPYLVFAIIKAESSFNPGAVSGKDARGLMQITDSTAIWGAGKLGLANFTTDRLYDPETNIMLGCWYLGWLSSQFDDIDLVIAAYNSGNGNVSKWLKNKDFSNTGVTLQKIPFKETDNFLKRVKSFWKYYSRLYSK